MEGDWINYIIKYVYASFHSFLNICKQSHQVFHFFFFFFALCFSLSVNITFVTIRCAFLCILCYFFMNCYSCLSFLVLYILEINISINQSINHSINRRVVARGHQRFICRREDFSQNIPLYVTNPPLRLVPQRLCFGWLVSSTRRAADCV